MADLNLLDFYKDTAKILLQLHQSFPRKVEVYIEDLIGTDHVDDFGLHSKRHESCFGAMLWLADEGYLRFQNTIHQDGIDQAILTAKTINLLGIVYHPTGDIKTTKPHTSELVSTFECNEKFTMIEHIRRSLTSGSSEHITSIIRVLFTIKPNS